MVANTKSAARPRLACELFSDRVLVARAAERRDMVEVHTARAVPGGTLALGLTTSNVLDSGALSRTVEEALGAVSGRSHDVCMVLPDAAVRVVLLDFETLPVDRDEALGVLRFRLRKSLPFDPERAAISYQAQRENGTVNVVAAVALASVVAEYEGAFQQAGYSPGIVLPSALAALGVVDGNRPTLLVKGDSATSTIAIVDQHQLRLIRTLDRSAGLVDAERLADEIYPSLVFFQDNFGSEIESILVGGEISAQQLAAAIAVHSTARVEPLVSESLVGGSLTGSSTPAASLAGVVGALLG